MVVILIQIRTTDLHAGYLISQLHRNTFIGGCKSNINCANLARNLNPLWNTCANIEILHLMRLGIVCVIFPDIPDVALYFRVSCTIIMV